MRNPLAISTMAVLLAAIVSPGRTEERQSSVTVYTSPEINLGEIDREIIDQVGAGGYINFAAFVLSDYAIIDALRSAALRGARIRLYLDPEELTRLRLSEDHPLVKLAHTQGVDTRAVSGALLRTGSANESVSGLAHQDNDLEIITDRAAIAAFDRKFKLMWDRPSNVNFNYLNDAKDLINPTARLNRVLRTTAMSTWHEVVAAA